MEYSEYDFASLEIRILADILSRLSKRDLEKRLSESKISLTTIQYFVLRMLSCGEYTISELSRKFSHDPATLVQAVDTLQKAGLVKRGQDPRDRRRAPLSLTGKGTELLEEVPLLDPEDALTRSLDRMGLERTRLLIGLLQEITAEIVDDESLISEITSAIQQLLERASMIPAISKV